MRKTKPLHKIPTVKLDSSALSTQTLVVVEQMGLPVPNALFLRGRNVLDRLAILTGSQRRG